MWRGGTNRQRGKSTLLLLLVLVAALVGVVSLLGPPPEPEPEPAPGPILEAPGGPEVVRPAATAEREPVRREESPDAPPWATVQGQLTKPGWADYPADMLLVLSPQDGTPGDEYRRLLHPGGVFFRFDEVPYGDWRLELRAVGFQHEPQLITLTPRDPHRHLLVALQPDRVIRGRVTTASGSPAAGAQVTATRVVEPGRAVLPLGATTDARGEFALSGAQPGVYRVQLGPARSPVGDPVQISFAPEAREGWVELQLPASGSVRLLVREAGTGKALPGVRVSATRVSRGLPGHTVSLGSDAEGVCAFAHLPLGEYAFVSLSGRYRSPTVRHTVLEGAEEELLLEVTVR
jgi:hypothetical protein